VWPCRTRAGGDLLRADRVPTAASGSPNLVEQWLDDRFPTILASPTPEDHRALVRQLAAAGRIGGGAYDALVAMTARTAGAVLVAPTPAPCLSTSSSASKLRFLHDDR